MIKAVYTDNFDYIKRRFKNIERENARVYTAEVSNTGPGRGLQYWAGYFIFNNDKLLAYVRREIRNLENLGMELKPRYMEAAISRGIVKYVEWLRSTTGFKPPVIPGGPWRPQHQGKWADITGMTNNSYRYRVNAGKWQVEPEWKAGLAEAKARYRAMYPGRKP